MVAAILALIMALVSFFGSKKAGASDGQAAAIAAAAGAGSYYVATETEWGQSIVGNISGWLGLKDPKGNVLLNADGSEVKAPKGATPVLNPDGTVARDPSGNVLWKLVDSSGKVLQNWGAAGTAGVIATGGAVAAADDFPWLWVGAGALALVVLTN